MVRIKMLKQSEAVTFLILYSLKRYKHGQNVRDIKELRGRIRISDGGRLEIQNATFSDSGNYSCNIIDRTHNETHQIHAICM